jgi:hypothetical protein
MSTYDVDERIDDYINALPKWQQDICQNVRTIVHAADPEVEETIKRSVQPYFVLHGNICALLAAKDHVNIFIYDPDVSDPARLINQGHDNATAQSIQISQGALLKEAALLAMFREIIARNRAGGWRKLRESA